jgi:hypothetical protein
MNQTDEKAMAISDEAGRMRQGIRDRWVRALKSGRYPQITQGPFLSRVYDGRQEWSALGVLCQVMDIPSEEVFVTPKLTIVRFDGADSYLTPRVCALAGIPKTRGTHVGRIFIDRTVYAQGYSIQSLSLSGVSFDQIAKIIEEQL